MRYFRVHSDENGVSHFAELEMRLAPLVLSLSTPALGFSTSLHKLKSWTRFTFGTTTPRLNPSWASASRKP